VPFTKGKSPCSAIPRHAWGANRLQPCRLPHVGQGLATWISPDAMPCSTRSWVQTASTRRH